MAWRKLTKIYIIAYQILENVHKKKLSSKMFY